MIILILLIFGSGHCRYQNKQDKRENCRNTKKDFPERSLGSFKEPVSKRRGICQSDGRNENVIKEAYEIPWHNECLVVSYIGESLKCLESRKKQTCWM